VIRLVARHNNDQIGDLKAQDSLSKPECDGRCEANGRKEGVSTAIVAGGNAAPVLEAAEAILDAVPLSIERLVVWDLNFSAARRGNA
jgi:hypothetical protein